ncbi:type II toxin-antitoxin system RelE/ParE family toxin [Sphingomonas sp.]|uniref:type II toxin-antitoxin system RelE/ParE family toxin n=1 Tax=Sphingomonas sp. TaxID=28214 RepID=UPI0031D628F5
MAKVELSRAARIDLLSIYDYSIENFGIDVAGKYLADVQHALAKLADFPELGPPASDLKRGTRCLSCRQHRIFYRRERGGVLIARILHAAMDPRKWLA